MIREGAAEYGGELAEQRFARQLGKSRSELYREALADYVARRDPGAITAALDDLADEIAGDGMGVTEHAARRVFERTEW